MNNARLSQHAPLLVFADDWGRHPSSCQHLIRRLQADQPIVWANTIGTRRVKADGFTIRRGWEKIRNWGSGVSQVSEQMWVVDLPMLPSVSGPLARIVNRRLVASRLHRVFARLKLTKPIVFTTLPYVNWLIQDLPQAGLVYYCTDDYSFWPDAEREVMQQAEREICMNADLVIAVSRALVARLGHWQTCDYLPHGVDLQHFASTAQKFTRPQELASLSGRAIGFFGLIYEKLDFQLLAALADRFSGDTLVMIGRVDFCPDWFRQRPNVCFVGPQPYPDLPRWLAALDVLLLPYVDDEMIRQSSPLKLRECLASGKPTVCVDVPEARLLEPHVRVANCQDEFLKHVDEALNEPPDSPLGKARQVAVACDDWDNRAQELRSRFNRLAAGLKVRPEARTA